MDEKDIKQQIRAFKKLKRACRAGSAERLQIHHKIKELQALLTKRADDSKEKEPIIKEILKYDKLLGKLDIDLRKFSIKELETHLRKVKT
jgi:hypothetical protein